MEVFMSYVQYTEAKEHGRILGIASKGYSRQNVLQIRRQLHDSSAVLHSPRRRGHDAAVGVRHATGIGTIAMEARGTHRMRKGTKKNKKEQKQRNIQPT